MAIIAADWSIDRLTGDIRYIGDDHIRFGGTTPSYATVIEFHRWLQDLADNASSAGDDELDITDENPSSRSTDNIITLLGAYNIDDNAAEHLYDGSIIQGVGVSQVIYDGIVNFGNNDVTIQLIQNGTVLADDWWNLSGGGGLNASIAAGISHRFMIKTVNAGENIDGRRLIGTSRTFGNTYAEFKINGTARGNNVLALSDSTDLNNESLEATVAGWTTITNSTEGYVQLDVDNNGTPENYASEWNLDTYSINQFYERMKWLTRDGSASTLYGLNGELFRGITTQITYNTLAGGTFADSTSVSFGNGATAQIIADNGTDTMWIQLLTGVTPATTDTITQGGVTAVCDVVTDREATIAKPFIGASTGSAIIGAYGWGIETLDLSASDKVTSLANVVITPPNNVTFTVSGIVHGEDRVLVAPWDGTTFDNEGNPAIHYDQLTLNTALTTDNVNSVVTSTAIPSDTPATGYIRVADNNGFYRRLHYSSWTGSTFTIDSTDGQEDFATVNASALNNVWIAYIDTLATGSLVTAGAFVVGVPYVIAATGTTDFTLIGATNNDPGTTFTATGAGTGTGTAYTQSASSSFTAVYNADRNLVVVVRDGANTPIKQFISSATLSSAGGSITAIRTSDT